MQKNKILYGLLLFSFWIAGCEDPYEKEEFCAYEEQPIGIYLETQADFSEWVKLLKKADLYNAMNISIKYTCFIADNEALATFLKSKGWNSVEEMTEEEAFAIASYHIVPDVDYAYTALSGKISNRTVSGDILTVSDSINDAGRKKFVYNSEIINLRRFEQPLINGVLHQLKVVLNPLIYTVMETLEHDAEYSIFTEALKVSGWNEYLNRRDIVVNEMKIRDYKTVIGVPDSIFHKEGIHSLADLRVRFEGEPLDKASAFNRFIAFHILDRDYDYGDLTAFEQGKSSGLNIPTQAIGEFLTVADIDRVTTLNPSDPVLLLKTNIAANNGYIHAVNRILEIVEPIRFPLEWEPTEWDEFRTIPFYRAEKSRTGENKVEDYFFTEPTEHMRWKSIPADGVKVSYNSVDIDWHRFKNDDSIYAFFTNSGYLEFDTPVLMKGRYNIKIEKWNWGEGGTYQLYIDGTKCGPQIFMGRSTARPDLGVFHFEGSGQHVVRFKVVKPGRFYLDRFIFTPVND